MAATFGDRAFDDQGNYRHQSFQDLFVSIGTHLAPEQPLPPRSS